MSEYIFGLGKGWLPQQADEIAQQYGARLVNYTDAQCNCGYGCKPHTCEKSRRHWFACRNLGNPHDQRIENAVLSAIAQQKGKVAK